MSQGQPTPTQQFGPRFDPSDLALLDFDISSLNSRKHYGALEFGILGRMSPAVDTPNNDGMIIIMKQDPNMFDSQIAEGYMGTANADPGIIFAVNGLPTAGEWDAQSRQNRMHSRIPTSESATVALNQNGDRHDSINGLNTCRIRHGQASYSTASPTSTIASAFGNAESSSTKSFFSNSTSIATPTLTKRCSPRRVEQIVHSAHPLQITNQSNYHERRSYIFRYR
jgi:hypothetical protein